MKRAFEIGDRVYDDSLSSRTVTDLDRGVITEVILDLHYVVLWDDHSETTEHEDYLRLDCEIPL